MGEIQKTDPTARRTALIIVCAGILVGASLIAAAERLRPMFEQWVTEDLKVRSRIVFGGLTVASVAPTLAAAAYLWRLGPRRRIMRGAAAALGTAGVLLVFFLWRVLFLLEAQ